MMMMMMMIKKEDGGRRNMSKPKCWPVQAAPSVSPTFLSIFYHAFQKLFSAGILGPLVLGAIYARPLGNMLPEHVQSAILAIGYLGLILLIVQGGLEPMAFAKVCAGGWVLLADLLEHKWSERRSEKQAQKHHLREHDHVDNPTSLGLQPSPAGGGTVSSALASPLAWPAAPQPKQNKSRQTACLPPIASYSRTTSGLASGSIPGNSPHVAWRDRLPRHKHGQARRTSRPTSLQRWNLGYCSQHFGRPCIDRHPDALKTRSEHHGSR